MSDDHDDSIKDDVDAVAKRLNVDVDVLRDISPEEIQYLIDHCPFLQIVDTVLHYGDDDEPPPVKLITSEKTGWTILDYGDAMSSSPGEQILGLYKDDDEDEGGKGGSIRGQAYLTASEMVEMAKARGWKGIQIVDGHIIMKRGAWITALDNGMPVAGFEPDAKDEAVRERVKMSSDALQVFRSKLSGRR